MSYWECPHCRFRVSDIEYLTIRVDPGCHGCHKTDWVEFRFVEEPDHVDA